MRPSKHAELHAEEDKKKKEVIEAPTMPTAWYTLPKKSLKELGDKVDAETRSKVEAAMASLKTALEGDNVDEIKRLTEELTQSSHKLAEAMYQQASQDQAGQAEPGAEAGAKPADEDDVVDADFEEVKEDKK